MAPLIVNPSLLHSDDDSQEQSAHVQTAPSHHGLHKSCADPESFVRGGPTLTTFVFCFGWRGDGGSKYHYKGAIIGPPAKHHWMEFRWRVDDGPALNAGLVAAIFQGIRTCIARKPYIFVIFQGGPDPLSPLWICTCKWSHFFVSSQTTL